MPMSIAEAIAPKESACYSKMKEFLDNAPTDPSKPCLFTNEELRAGAGIGSLDSVYRVARQFDFSAYRAGGGGRGMPVLWGNPKAIAAFNKIRQEQARQRSGR